MKFFLLLLLTLLWCPPVRAQQPATAPRPGQILFSAAPIPAGEYTSASTYIGYRTYTLTLQSRLYLTAFLTTSLPDALARMGPQAQGTDFMKMGSFQYCFYVDEQIVYTAYLQPEPQYLLYSDAQPILHQPLITPDNTPRKNQSLWGLFQANGGKKALSTGSHLLRLVIRPYIQSPLLQVGPVLAAGQVALQVTPHAERPR